MTAGIQNEEAMDFLRLIIELAANCVMVPGEMLSQAEGFYKEIS